MDGRRDYYLNPGNPAALFIFNELRPEALRPNLSEGLPFSYILVLYTFMIVIGIKNAKL